MPIASTDVSNSNVLHVKDLFRMSSDYIKLQDIHRKFTHGQVCHRFHMLWGTMIEVFIYFPKKQRNAKGGVTKK
jgi:membrane-bound metal-dependent hydrolase YbcI (DUF457 family)